MPLHHNQITAATHLCMQRVHDVAMCVKGHWHTGMIQRRLKKLLCVHSHLEPIFCQFLNQRHLNKIRLKCFLLNHKHGSKLHMAQEYYKPIPAPKFLSVSQTFNKVIISLQMMRQLIKSCATNAADGS